MTNNARDVQPQVALVTGGGSGIGEAVARRLVRSGTYVAVVDSDEARGRRATRRLGDDSLFVHADVSRSEHTERMVAEVLEEFGRLDIAVNSAGINEQGVASPIHELPDETWERVMSVNLTGVFNSMRSELRRMLEGGRGAIVNIASIMSKMANPGIASYVASKHGVLGLTRAAAVEYGHVGIRVNAVGPGYVDTPLLSVNARKHLGTAIARHPLGRIATPDEVAAVVVFLASPQASFVTGSYYAVDGGYSSQ